MAAPIGNTGLPVKFYSTRFFTHFKPQNFVLFANEMAGFFQRAVTYVLHNTYFHTMGKICLHDI